MSGNTISHYRIVETRGSGGMGTRQDKSSHPLMLRATAVKKKNDRIDAGKICDCLRCERSLPTS